MASFDIFWRAFAENYPYFAAQKIGWPAVVARYRRLVSARTTPGSCCRDTWATCASAPSRATSHRAAMSRATAPCSAGP
ncbi:MAG: hypothetical protein ACLPUO_01340 [Streptosporangiaceae bacterium]